MHRILLVAITIFLMSSALEARNNTCWDAYEIPEMSNLSESKTYTKTGNLSVTDLDDFFKFTPKNNGKLTIDYSSSRNTDIYIKSTTKGCLDAALVVNSKIKLNTRSYSVTIDVKKNETVYIRASKLLHLPGQSTTYSIKMSFDTGGYSIDWQDSINGNIKVIGNSVLREKGNKCPSDVKNNDSIDTVFANVDGQSSNSTSAKLTIPEGAKVKYATLYWQGYFEDVKTEDITNSKKIKFKPAGSSAYRTVESDNRYKGIYLGKTLLKNPYAYQGAQDVTAKVKQSGNYFVADLKTDTGRPTGGAYGAWALVVVYEDINETYKNITIYDGFEIVSSDKNYKDRSYKLTGFLTPLKNTVNSTFLYFVGEGDSDIAGDTVSLTKKNGSAVKLENSHKPKNNAFNSRISIGDTLVTDRNPNCKNTIGIDIGSFNVGSSGQKIIENGQIETTVNLTSTQDKYFPGMFAFATDLYKPDVCYTAQKVYLVDTNTSHETPLSSGDTVDLNSTIRIEATIRNKGADEDAYRVRLSHLFDELTPYRVNSLKMGGVSKTDDMGDDLAHYDPSIDRIYFHLGAGATPTEGGVLAKGGGVSERISFMRDLNASKNLTLKYQIDYSNTANGSGSLNLENNTIFECTDIPDFVLQVGSSDVLIYDDYPSNYSNKKLFTKIVGTQEATYRVDTSRLKTRYKDDPDLTIRFQGDVVHTMTIKSPDNTFTMKDKFGRAEKSVRFDYTVGEGELADENTTINAYHASTRESFAIRPKEFVIKSDEIVGFVGDELDITEINAVNISNINATGYNQTIRFASGFETDLDHDSCEVSYIVPPQDKISIIRDYENSIMADGSVSFTNGSGSFNNGSGSFSTGKVSFSEVGDINLTLRDNDWAKNDIDATGRCKVGESFSKPDKDGQVGCDITGSVRVYMMPRVLDYSVSPSPNSDLNWSYMSEEPDYSGSDMSAMRLVGTITGYLDEERKKLAKNLTAGCWDPSTKVTLTSPNANKEFSLPASSIIGELVKDNRYDGYDHNLSTYWADHQDDNISGLYDGGKATFYVMARAGRVHSKTRDPIALEDLRFKLELPDLIGAGKSKLISTSHDLDNGEIVDRTLSRTHHFYYGRVYAPKITTGEPKDVAVWYFGEIFCTSKADCPDATDRLSESGLKGWRVMADRNSIADLNASFDSGQKENDVVAEQSGVKFDLGNDRPNGAYIIHITDMGKHLHYNQYSEFNADPDVTISKGCNVDHPCIIIDLQRGHNDWGGTEKGTGRKYDDNASKERSQQRLNW